MIRIKRSFRISFNKSLKIRTILISMILLLVIYFHKQIYLRYYTLYYIERDAIIKPELRDFTSSFMKFTSKCKCRQNETVTMMKTPRYYVFDVDDSSKQPNTLKKRYTISHAEFESSILMCDLYNSLRRGPKQRVISFALYGRDLNYYFHLKELAEAVRKRYPGWLIRVYFDHSIDEEFICETECLTYFNENTKSVEYLDIVDFCDIEQLPYDTIKVFNYSYMHGMTRRWLPIGDSFVDYFGSRDTDGWISERETDSVKVWLDSNTPFHVMRDHPFHNVPILGGCWSYANVRNRELGVYIFKIITNPVIAQYYNPGRKHLKGYDQFMLTDFVSTFSFKNSTTHDSYLCDEIDGNPWPSKRPLNYCFVGCSDCCDQPNYHINKDIQNLICPERCRPKMHKDWIYC